MMTMTMQPLALLLLLFLLAVLLMLLLLMTMTMQLLTLLLLLSLLDVLLLLFLLLPLLMLKLPAVLRWFTGSIGYHHIHHLAPRVPNYSLRDCHNAVPELSAATRILTLRKALISWRYALWDEASGRMVNFRSRARPHTARPPARC